MVDERDKIVARIGKLLARTEDRGATKAEAEACVTLAHRLMLKHGIAAEDLRDDDEPVKHVLWAGTRRPVEMLFVSALVAEHFNVKAMAWRAGDAKVELLLGRPYHVKIAQHVWHYLVRAFGELWDAHRKKHGQSPGAKRSYCQGLAVALHERLSAQARRVTEADTEVQNAIIRIGDDLAMMVDRAFGPGVRVQNRRCPSGPFDQAAAIQGMADSEHIQLHDALASEVA